MSRAVVLFVVLTVACTKAAVPTVAGEAALAPVFGDEGVCGRLNDPDATIVEAAVATLSPRVASLSAWAGRDEDAVRAWCLAAFEQTFYLHNGCAVHGRSCELEACVDWRTRHGARPDDAVATCMQDCNCGE